MFFFSYAVDLNVMKKKTLCKLQLINVQSFFYFLCFSWAIKPNTTSSVENKATRLPFTKKPSCHIKFPSAGGQAAYSIFTTMCHKYISSKINRAFKVADSSFSHIWTRSDTRLFVFMINNKEDISLSTYDLKIYSWNLK